MAFPGGQEEEGARSGAALPGGASLGQLPLTAQMTAPKGNPEPEAVKLDENLSQLPPVRVETAGCVCVCVHTRAPAGVCIFPCVHVGLYIPMCTSAIGLVEMSATPKQMTLNSTYQMRG